MHDLSAHITEPHFGEYSSLCAAVHHRLVHANLAAHVVWEILEFQRLAGDVFMPTELDLQRAVLSNAADRVVVTAVALSERRRETLNFRVLVRFLEKNVHPSSRSTIATRLAQVRLDERRKGLLGRAERTRNELIAHFNAAQAVGTASSDRRLLIEDVLDLQDVAQELLDLLRPDRAAYTSHTARSRQMLRLLASAYGSRIKGVSKAVLEAQLAPGTVLPGLSPWKLGRLPS